MSLTLTCEQLETEQHSRFNLIQFVRTHTQSAFNHLYAGFFNLFLSLNAVYSFIAVSDLVVIIAVDRAQNIDKRYRLACAD